jgi:PAS domain S-box-containing protein
MRIPTVTATDQADRSERSRAAERMQGGGELGPGGSSSLPVVLIVDDNAENLLALQAMLQRDDVEILTASSGQAALEILLERKIAVAIVDVMMPEIDGFELAELIRGVDRTRRVPIIFVTAGSRAEYQVFTGYETGAIDFLFKPVNDRVLRAKVDVLVSLEKQRQRINSALQQAERSRAETEVLFHLAQATSQCEQPEDVYDPALDAVRGIFGADPAAVLLLKDDGLIPLHASRSLSEPIRAALERCYRCSSVRRESRPLLIHDVAEDESIAPHYSRFVDEGIRAIGFVPLVSQHEVLGAFLLCWDRARSFSEHETNLALTIASHIADAIQRLRLRAAERSARVLAEAAEQKLLMALDAGRMGVWEWAIASDRVDCSPTLESILGLDPGAFPGTFEAFHRNIHPDDRDRVLGVFREALEKEGDHHVEYRILRPDGEERWMAGSAKLSCDEAGEPLSIIGVSADVTERKHLEKTREATLAELEQTLRYNEIFAGILAHDLRNPLGAILNAAQVLLLDGEPGRMTHWLDRIVSSGQRMTRMINQLLDFTRARVGGGIELEPRASNLAKICGQAVAELELANPEWKIRLESLGDVSGTWDSDRLLQVASNLIANAGQHGTAGADVVVGLDGTDSHSVMWEVRNDGAIDEALLPDLFSPFRGARERRSDGLGLGLFISRKLIVSHGGTIEVASAETTGTTFRIRLPRRVSDPGVR